MDDPRTVVDSVEVFGTSFWGLQAMLTMRQGTGRARGARGRRLGVWVLGALLVPAISTAVAQFDDIDVEPINYSSSVPNNAVSRLQQKLDRGEVKLTRDPVRGYLPSVLKALDIPVSSQGLVWSKTSLQRDWISPRTPRALYFNDEVYVGWVNGGRVLEISAVDPKLGTVFYVVNQAPGEEPKFIRQTHECLSCHGSGLSGGVPGHIVRSVWADATGQPILAAGSFVTNDQSPLEERWGGWYVTGTHGAQRHMGNIITHSAAQAANANLSAGANVTDLSRRFDTSDYLSKHSDLVAVMVLEHQAFVHNLITRAGYETRRALQFEQLLNRDLGRPANFRSDSTTSRIKAGCEPLVKGLLFSKAAPLTFAVKGTSTFAEDFQKQGPRDKQDRSLRELDLQQRLFRYPCSFLIHSEAFDALPPEAKSYVYGRLRDILDGKDTSPDFAHLTAADRTAIREILTETKKEFATP